MSTFYRTEKNGEVTYICLGVKQAKMITIDAEGQKHEKRCDINNFSVRQNREGWYNMEKISAEEFKQIGGADAATRAKNKYNKANYKQFLVSMKPEGFEELEKAVAAAGVSRNQFILEAIEEYIEKRRS